MPFQITVGENGDVLTIAEAVAQIIAEGTTKDNAIDLEAGVFAEDFTLPPGTTIRGHGFASVIDGEITVNGAGDYQLLNLRLMPTSAGARAIVFTGTDEQLLVAIDCRCLPAAGTAEAIVHDNTNAASVIAWVGGAIQTLAPGHGQLVLSSGAGAIVLRNATIEKADDSEECVHASGGFIIVDGGSAILGTARASGSGGMLMRHGQHQGSASPIAVVDTYLVYEHMVVSASGTLVADGAGALEVRESSFTQSEEFGVTLNGGNPILRDVPRSSSATFTGSIPGAFQREGVIVMDLTGAGLVTYDLSTRQIGRFQWIAVRNTSPGVNELSLNNSTGTINTASGAKGPLADGLYLCQQLSTTDWLVYGPVPAI